MLSGAEDSRGGFNVDVSWIDDSASEDCCTVSDGSFDGSTEDSLEDSFEGSSENSFEASGVE